MGHLEPRAGRGIGTPAPFQLGRNMTTKVHIVNFGPDNVVVLSKDPATHEVKHELFTVSPQMSVDVYVHSGQALEVREVQK